MNIHAARIAAIIMRLSTHPRPGRARKKSHGEIRVGRTMLRRLAIIFCLLFPISALRAMPDLPALCEDAALVAAAETGVPVSVLRAITLTETGRKYGKKLRPWPWTVNMEGAGKWFPTAQEARAYAQNRFDSGARSFDVGCFQINYRWHGQAFDSVEQMFEPLANARYAARFLKRLYAESGDWSVAAGAYHSRTPVFAERYRARFDRLRAGLEGAAPAETNPAPVLMAAAIRRVQTPRVNTYPLLRVAATRGSLGSLVPMAGRSAGPGLLVRE